MYVHRSSVHIIHHQTKLLWLKHLIWRQKTPVSSSSITLTPGFTYLISVGVFFTASDYSKLSKRSQWNISVILMYIQCEFGMSVWYHAVFTEWQKFPLSKCLETGALYALNRNKNRTKLKITSYHRWINLSKSNTAGIQTNGFPEQSWHVACYCDIPTNPP